MSETKELNTSIIKNVTPGLPWSLGTAADVNTCYKTGRWLIAPVTANKPAGITWGLLDVTFVGDISKQELTSLAPPYSTFIRIQNGFTTVSTEFSVAWRRIMTETV